MKITRVLLRIGGVINALFFLFHLWLGWQIHQWAGLPPTARILMEMLNGGGALFILLLTFASFACTVETFATRLGRMVLIAAGLLYGLRGVSEVFITPVFQPAVCATCLVTGGIYLAVFFLASAASPTPPAGEHDPVSHVLPHPSL